jgi:hypothetical protein
LPIILPLNIGICTLALTDNLTEMQELKQEINASISQGSFRDDFTVSLSDLITAIHKLNTGKGDWNGGLSFYNSGDDLYGYLSFLFSSMLVRGTLCLITSQLLGYCYSDT